MAIFPTIRPTFPVLTAQPIGIAPPRAPLPDKQVVIDTDVKAAERPKIVRDGKAVGSVLINDIRLNNVLVGFRPIITRVVSQSIAPGTPVAKGTTINLVLAAAERIPLNVIDGIHPQLANENMQTAFDKFLKNDGALQNLVARAASGDALAPAERAQAETLVRAKGINVTATAGSDIDAVLTGLAAAHTFNG